MQLITPLRLRKIWRALWGNPTRAVLIILATTVGVFSVGAVHGTQLLLSQDLNNGYRARTPSSVTLYTDRLMTQETVKSVRRMADVLDAEGRRSILVRAKSEGEPWRDMRIEAWQDYDDLRLHRVLSQGGAWPPPKKTLLLERDWLQVAGLQVGDALLIKTPLDARHYALPITGVAHDMNKVPSEIDDWLYGYVTFETLAWLGYPPGFNELHLLVNSRDKAEIREIAKTVEEKLAKSGYVVRGLWLPTPGVHPIDEIVQPLLSILGVFGLLALSLSGFLIINTISAILTQHIPQIGIMKAIGARRRQIITLYAGIILLVVFLALLIAIPSGAVAAYFFTSYLAQVLNFDMVGMRIPQETLARQMLSAFTVPVFAALGPIWTGSRISVHQALAYLGGQRADDLNWFIHKLGRIRFLPRPLLLSLRNTMRRRLRLLLTVSVLVVAGATVVTYFNMKATLRVAHEEFVGYWSYDVQVDFVQTYRSTQIEQIAKRFTKGIEMQPELVQIEYWNVTRATFIDEQAGDGHNFTLMALPQSSTMIRPSLVAGRWLLPADRNAVVIDTDVLENEPAIAVGKTIRLRIEQRESDWQVVGVVKPSLTSGLRFGNIYVNDAGYADIVHRPGKANSLRVVTAHHAESAQLETALALEEFFDHYKLHVQTVRTSTAQQDVVRIQFDIMLTVLLITIIILIIAGGLGLASTVSMNVLERTREIGVMRAIGASDGAILQIFIVEGVLISLISWPFAVLLANPISDYLATQVGQQFTGSPFSYVTSTPGIGLWLVVVIALAVVSSYFPARNATHVTVRNVLDYE